MIDHRQPGEPAIRDDDGTLIALTDWRGQTYRVGDLVMYCIGAGRGQQMAEGRVIQLRETPHDNGYWQNGKRIKTSEWIEYGVQVLTERTSGQWDNERRTRPAWVNEMNITALPILAPLAAGE